MLLMNRQPEKKIGADEKKTAQKRNKTRHRQLRMKGEKMEARWDEQNEK